MRWLSPSCERANFNSTEEEPRWLPTTNQLTHCDVATSRRQSWENTSEKGPFFSTTFSRPFKDQSGAWRNGTSFGINDLEALLTVAREAKEWMATHALRANLRLWEASGPPGASLRSFFRTGCLMLEKLQLFLMIISTSPYHPLGTIIMAAAVMMCESLMKRCFERL